MGRAVLDEKLTPAAGAVQPAQLDAAQPLQEDAPAELDTVSPPLPLDIKPQGDINLDTFLPLHDGQFGFSLPKSRYSKS